MILPSSLRDLRFLGSRVRLWGAVGDSRSAGSSSVLVFLHGSGISALGMEKWMARLVKPPPGTIVILPSAPMQIYKLDNMLQSVWHQRTEVSISSTYEDLEGLDRVSHGLQPLVAQLREAGVARVVLGGFSMGAHTALHAVYRGGLQVDGCLALSTYLVEQSALYRSLDSCPSLPLPPLLQAHGQEDSIVPPLWAVTTQEELLRRGVEGQLRLYQGLGHEPRADMLEDAFSWLQGI